MHIVRFFPIGNADTCLIELANGRRILFDFADMHSPDDPDDKRCDLEKELREILGDDKVIDVVAFTHLDKDHCNQAKEVFYLEHAGKYQDDDRIKIKTLWVPAHAVLEKGVTGQARHRSSLVIPAKPTFRPLEWTPGESSTIRQLCANLKMTSGSRALCRTTLGQ